ncbi:MAG: DUF4160 domain-containing protein [Armatimonadota bacterium]
MFGMDAIRYKCPTVLGHDEISDSECTTETPILQSYHPTWLCSPANQVTDLVFPSRCHLKRRRGSIPGHPTPSTLGHYKVAETPLISEFRGIKIYMYRSDHMPPHFHVQCGHEKALAAIATGEILAGSLSVPILRDVRTWQHQHSRELEENWGMGQRAATCRRIAPLE